MNRKICQYTYNNLFSHCSLALKPLNLHPSLFQSPRHEGFTKETLNNKIFDIKIFKTVGFEFTPALSLSLLQAHFLFTQLPCVHMVS